MKTGINIQNYNNWKTSQAKIFKTKFASHIFLPEGKTLMYYDIIVLIITFFLTLLCDFTARSIQFNISIAVLLVIKVAIGANFAAQKTFTILRWHMTLRVVVDALLIIPAMLVFKMLFSTSAWNLLIVFLVLTFSELLLLARNFNYLYYIGSIE